MAASMETQRLITVSLGKIAQSRGQRGGINLHKNLLVATVLHKARTAYMMESYSYQQSVRQQQVNVRGDSVMNKACPPTWSDSTTHDHQGLPEPIPTAADNTVLSDISAWGEESSTQEHMDSETAQDKENSPPPDNILDSSEHVNIPDNKPTESDHHLSAANQLALDAQAASLNCRTTCKVQKRRRTCRTYSSDCPVSKKARVSSDAASPSPTQFSDCSEYSEESDFQSETQDSPQISNLVSIFNSGFSGLCAINDSELNTPNYQSELEVSNPQSQLSLSKLRPETPSAFSRIVADSSLLCSSQVSRLDTLPSAIVLSA